MKREQRRIQAGRRSGRRRCARPEAPARQKQHRRSREAHRDRSDPAGIRQQLPGTAARDDTVSVEA
jgi:hypothetical protein